MGSGRIPELPHGDLAAPLVGQLIVPADERPSRLRVNAQPALARPGAQPAVIVVGHQVGHQSPVIPEEPLRHDPALHDLAQEGRQVGQNIIAEVLPELCRQARTPRRLLGDLPAIDVGVGQGLACKGTCVGDQHPGRGVEMPVHRAGVQGIDLQSGTARTRELGLARDKRRSQPDDQPSAGRHRPCQSTAGSQLGRQVRPGTWRELEGYVRPIAVEPISQHGDVAVVISHGRRLRQDLQNLHGPANHRLGVDHFLGGILRLHPGSSGVPAAAEVNGERDAHAVGLGHGEPEELAPGGTHEVRALGSARSPFARVEEEGPGDALPFHRLEIAGDSVLRDAAVQPPPVDPRPGRGRWVAKAVLEPIARRGSHCRQTGRQTKGGGQRDDAAAPAPRRPSRPG